MMRDEMLMGRLRYEILAKDWAAQTGEYAAVIDETTRHVFSSTVEMAAWKNSTIVNRFGKTRVFDRARCFVETRSDAGCPRLRSVHPEQRRCVVTEERRSSRRNRRVRDGAGGPVTC